MYLRRMIRLLVLLFCTAPQLSEAQYFLRADPQIAAQSLVQAQSKEVRFEEDAKVSRRIYDSDLAFVPARPQAGVNVNQMEKGLLLGKFSSNKAGSLGTNRKASLPAGTYQMWIVRHNRVWTIVATDEKGVPKAMTNEVTLHMDKADKGPFFSALRAHLMLPPYALVTDEGKIIPAADEGPGTVHGCQCWTVWTQIDDPDTPGRGTTCWPYTRCSCWN